MASSHDYLRSRVTKRLSLEALEQRQLLALSDGALSLLNARANFDQAPFYVYDDAGSGFNHSTPSGLFAGPGVPGLSQETLERVFEHIELDAACVHDPRAPKGCSTDTMAMDRNRGNVLSIDIDPALWDVPSDAPIEFAGLIFEEPQGFVEDGYGRGYDLAGATSVKFDVLSPTEGGVSFAFGVAGYDSQFMHIPQGDTFAPVTLTFAELGISNSELGLRDVQDLFSLTTTAKELPGGGTLLIDNVRFDPSPRSWSGTPGIVLGNQIFGIVPHSEAPIPADQAVRNLATTYEASLTILSLLDRGEVDDLQSVRKIADGLLYALENDLDEPPGIPPARDGSRALHDGYSSGSIALFNGQREHNTRAGLAQLNECLNGTLGCPLSRQVSVSSPQTEIQKCYRSVRSSLEKLLDASGIAA